ncbi:hypothetical protein [Nocardiopsis valliformis]|uniref:hypothetical protein n=1 Tax=Nocardiopsis valliformis TaxID=239974 RepID=UPI001872F0EA|nr:hypothetical protein [Nocardiopsis valliformis]
MSARRRSAPEPKRCWKTECGAPGFGEQGLGVEPGDVPGTDDRHAQWFGERGRG